MIGIEGPLIGGRIIASSVVEVKPRYDCCGVRSPSEVSSGRSDGSCSHERLGAAFLDQVSILIENSSVPGDDASPTFGLGLQRLDGGQGVDRVPEDDRPMKLPFEDRQKCEGVDARRLAHQAGGDGQTEQSMSHRPAEGVVSAGE